MGRTLSQMIVTLAIAGTLVGSLAFFRYFKIATEDGSLRIVRRDGAASSADDDEDQRDENEDDTPAPHLRIGTFDVEPFDEAKLQDETAMECILAQLTRHDVIAVQGFHSRSQSVLITLLERLHKKGFEYDFACSPKIGREPIDDFNAFLFDENTIEVDRSTVREVRDPDRVFTIRPLVAAFRAKGPPQEEAFTFTAINVRVDSAADARQVDLLADVYRAVRDDGRDEDDIILLGRLCDRELNTDLNALALTRAIGPIRTTVDGTQSLDNILFRQRATVEFTGRSGIIDLLREYEFTFDEALDICTGLPLVAEFSAYEGGRIGGLDVDR